MTTVGEIRAALISRRRVLRMSQRELAGRLGTAQSAISELESGLTIHPNIDTLIRWAEALNATLNVTLEYGQDNADTVYWTTTEVARFLDVLPSTVSNYRRRHQMPQPVHTYGRTHIWRSADIVAWVGRGRSATGLMDT